MIEYFSHSPNSLGKRHPRDGWAAPGVWNTGTFLSWSLCHPERLLSNLRGLSFTFWVLLVRRKRGD